MATDGARSARSESQTPTATHSGGWRLWENPQMMEVEEREGMLNGPTCLFCLDELIGHRGYTHTFWVGQLTYEPCNRGNGEAVHQVSGSGRPGTTDLIATNRWQQALGEFAKPTY